MTTQSPGSNTNTARISPLLTTENRFGDCYIEDFVGTTFESTNATIEFQRRFGDALFQENTLYVVVGSDSGLLPQFIIDRGLPRGSRYLFIEPGEIAPHIDSKFISTELATRIAISSATHWVECAHELALLNYTYSGKISYVRSCAAQQAAHRAYPALTQAVNRELRHLFWLFTAQFDSHIFFNSQLANLAENRVPSAHLRGSFKGKCAIILGAGPSLDELIPWIKQHRNDAVLIAVSRISARLLQAGIEPDIIVSIDPQFVSFSVSKEMLNLGNRTIFINGCHTTPLLLGQWPHQNLFLGPRLPWDDDDFDNIETIPPTVTNNAILLAQEFGCSQIVLTGVDLCYSAAGHTHAQGTVEYAAGPMLGRIDYTVTTNAGIEAETNKGYYEAIKVISRQAVAASKHNCKIINLAITAAKIEGVEYIHPDALIIDEPLIQSAWQTLSSLLDKDSREDRCNYYNTMIELLDKAINDLIWIKKLSTIALNCNTKMAALINTSEYSKHKSQMEKIERRLEIRFKMMSKTVKRYNSVGFAKIITADSGDDWSADELFNKTKIYYEEFLHGATLLLEVINDAKQRLRSRIEEERPSPDFEMLFNQWQQDIGYGRADIWKQRHPETYKNASPQVKERIKSMHSQFHAMLSADKENFEQGFKNLISAANTFGSIVENSITYHAKGDVMGLKRISTGLSKRTEPLAIQTKLFTDGLIAELEHNPKQAEALYYSIDAEINSDLKQIALERIVNFSLVNEDYQTILPALKLLAESRVNYQPFYARFLALTGEVTEAIAAYTHYLQEYPGDLDTMLELGILLSDVGAREAAESALGHIMDTDPNHPAVEKLTQILKQK